MQLTGVNLKVTPQANLSMVMNNANVKLHKQPAREQMGMWAVKKDVFREI